MKMHPFSLYFGWMWHSSKTIILVACIHHYSLFVQVKSWKQVRKDGDEESDDDGDDDEQVSGEVLPALQSIPTQEKQVIFLTSER
ncbi:hypothetical protein SUGI_0624630 [Cryptomeria japonica]|nr:hypothetical protein SUGI_0624630 [Cryptomeria japonica]